MCDCGNARLCSDIQRLWKLAGQQYGACKQQTNLTVGNYTIWDDMPTAPDQVMPLLMHECQILLAARRLMQSASALCSWILLPFLFSG